jgi:hypothetical protein
MKEDHMTDETKDVQADDVKEPTIKDKLESLVDECITRALKCADGQPDRCRNFAQAGLAAMRMQKEL